MIDFDVDYSLSVEAIQEYYRDTAERKRDLYNAGIYDEGVWDQQY